MRIATTLTTILAIVILAISCTKEKENGILTDNIPVQSSSSITLGNQSTSNFNCFFSFDSMKVYKFADAVNNQSVIDLIFFHNNPDDLAILLLQHQLLVLQHLNLLLLMVQEMVLISGLLKILLK